MSPTLEVVTDPVPGHVVDAAKAVFAGRNPSPVLVATSDHPPTDPDPARRLRFGHDAIAIEVHVEVEPTGAALRAWALPAMELWLERHEVVDLPPDTGSPSEGAQLFTIRPGDRLRLRVSGDTLDTPRTDWFQI